jgi:uncharacterized membrane protein HdeD (DUF308 family)
MRRIILLSAALLPVLLGLIASLDRRPRRGLLGLVVLYAVFTLFYGVLLHYAWLRLAD